VGEKSPKGLRIKRRKKNSKKKALIFWKGDARGPYRGRDSLFESGGMCKGGFWQSLLPKGRRNIRGNL